MKRKLLALLLALTMLILPTLCSCATEEEDDEFDPYEVTHTATIEIENYGIIELELYRNAAPITVDNFISLASEGFYDGLTFHRIIDGFMMQGGGFDTTGAERRSTSIVGEFPKNGVDNPIKHKRGVISMARANSMNSASSQFFIMHQAAEHLDGLYAAFGKVTSGIEVVDKICTEAQPIDGNGSIRVADRPVIKTVTVVEK